MRKKPKKIKYKGPTLMDRLPDNQGEWLMLVIKNTKKVLGDHTEPAYQYLEDQLFRLEDQLVQWKQENPGTVLRDL
jgi:hypothetical protein